MASEPKVADIDENSQTCRTKALSMIRTVLVESNAGLTAESNMMASRQPVRNSNSSTRRWAKLTIPSERLQHEDANVEPQ